MKFRIINKRRKEISKIRKLINNDFFIFPMFENSIQQFFNYINCKLGFFKFFSISTFCIGIIVNFNFE